MDIELILPEVHPGRQAIKRGVDIVGALSLLVFLSPIMLLTGLVVKLTSPGKVIFRQVRIGREGRPFWMYKFRSMDDRSEDPLNRLPVSEPQQRLEFERFQKLADDPRLTQFGRVLRRSSLDELPQLWNVIKGDMSLVGPRPFLPEQKELYGAGFHAYCQLRPGLTGLWQVSGRNRLSFAQRAALDDYYYSHWSFWLDLVILARTVWVVARQEGAY